MSEKTFTLHEILELVAQYNNSGEFNGPNKIDSVTWRKNISFNLASIYKIKGVKNKQVLSLMYPDSAEQAKHVCKVNSWTAISSPNVPTFEDIIRLSEMLDFDIRDLFVPKLFTPVE